MADFPGSSDPLKKVNEEVYKQNFELTIRNKTLSVLRSLYASTAAALEINPVAQHIVDTITKELRFAAAMINLVDETTQSLRLTAITQSPLITQALELIGKPVQELIISLDFPNNLLVNSIKSGTRQITGNVLDILDPLVSQETADQIENITHIKTLIVYPLTIDHKKQGTLTIALAKKVDDLSRAEKESLEELIGPVSLSLDRASLHEDLRRANEKLKELDQLKDDFVSLASHELRTPMTAIKSYTWMVLNNKAGEISPTAKDYLDKVFFSTERLIRLVSEMLDISRIESGRVQLKIEPFDFTQLLIEVKGEFAAKAIESKLTLDIVLPPSPTQVLADREKIHQVLENLVGNAFKFTPAGGKVSIGVKLLLNLVEVAIVDTGQGISEADIPKLFHKFGRLEKERSLEAVSKGTGLGLYICRHYIEMCHGQISVSSTLGVGSTFTITIPIV